jgi:RHS repeat-associated protein
VTYGHNAFGEQIWRSDGSNLQHFLFDQQRRVAEVAIQGGQWRIKRRYLYANETPVAMIDYEHGKGQLMFIHADSVGLPRVVTDARQRIRWRGRFSPFGKLMASEGLLDLPLRLPGQTADSFTGWHDNYQRTYDPDWGHYLEPDPLGSVPGVRPWGYAEQQPRRHVDPLGLMMFAFDGTRNRPESMTNVWLMGQAYRDGLVHYISGPGDEQAMKPADAVWDAAIAWSGSQRVGLQWERLLQAIASHPQKAPPLVVDVTGFSRGAALARDFSHRLATHVQDGRFWLNDTKRGVLTACMDLRFMGLFDTVAQFNPLGSGNAAFNLSISPKWKWAAHAVAAHERRWLFPLSAAKGSGNVVERPFVGAHADIGGGYLTARASPGSTPGNLSNVALQWMAWQAQAAGVRLSLTSDSRLFDQPVIHDERSAISRRVQNGDRAVLHADGRKWVEYQAEHPEYGQALRKEVAAFIQNTPPPGIGVAPDVVGWVDMPKYADWLRQRLGFALPQ